MEYFRGLGWDVGGFGVLGGVWRVRVFGVYFWRVCVDMPVGGVTELGEAFELSIVGVGEGGVHFGGFLWEDMLYHVSYFSGQFVVCV